MASSKNRPPGKDEERSQRRWRLTEAYFGPPKVAGTPAPPADGLYGTPPPSGFRPEVPPMQNPALDAETAGAFEGAVTAAERPPQGPPQTAPAQASRPPGSAIPPAPQSPSRPGPAGRPAQAGAGQRPPPRPGQRPGPPAGSAPPASPNRGAPPNAPSRQGAGAGPGGPPKGRFPPAGAGQKVPRDLTLDDLPPEVRAAMESAPLPPRQRAAARAPGQGQGAKPGRPGMPPMRAPGGRPGAGPGGAPGRRPPPAPKRSFFSWLGFGRKSAAPPPPPPPPGSGPRRREPPPGMAAPSPRAPQKPQPGPTLRAPDSREAGARDPAAREAAGPELPPQPVPQARTVRRPTSPIEALEPKPAPAPMPSTGRKSPIADEPKIKYKPAKDTGEQQSMRRSGGAVGAAYIISTLLFLVALVGSVFYYGWIAFEGDGPLNEGLVVSIERGTSLKEIAEELERAGAIDDSNIFLAGVYLSGKKGAMKAGEYAIPANASMANVMTILSEGRSIQFKATIPEGYTSAQAVEILNAQEELTGPIESIPPEGSLLPETYTFPRGTARQQIIDKMLKDQAAVLEDLWSQRAPNLPIKTPEEAVILASIVEKETGVPEERRQVASVFVNRLRRNMRLQSDPTIIYGITEGKGPLGRPIYQSDIDRPTPYNTYQVDGLPPTPIANPGRAALEATLNPAETDYLYFVADGSGGHAFASTLSEHTRNVARWRQVERRLRQEQAKAAAEKAVSGEATTETGATGATGGGAESTGVIETETRELVLPSQ